MNLRICAILSLAIPALLSACNPAEVKDTLGITKKAPDEFRVVSRPPLSVPPEFSLRPPQEGTPPGPSAAESQARGLVTAGSGDTAVTPVSSGGVPTTAESQFLSRTGADRADSNVRDEIYEETAKPKEKEWWESWTLWEDPKNKQPEDDVVNAAKEAERIKQNKEAGLPANAEAPAKQADENKKDSGFLGIF